MSELVIPGGHRRRRSAPCSRDAANFSYSGLRDLEFDLDQNFRGRIAIGLIEDGVEAASVKCRYAPRLFL